MADGTSLRHPLRGRLPADGLGARGLERAARNPACLRVQALTAAGLSPMTAVREVLAEDVREGQSPFAITEGLHFERFLFADDAAHLRTLYAREGALPAQDVAVCDLSRVVPGSAPEDRARRHTETLALLRRCLAGDATVPRVVLKPRLVVRVGDVDHEIEPDALVLRTDDAFYRVVEVKAYVDREGKTAPEDLRSATRQAAVGVVALRQAVEALGGCDAAMTIPAAGDLVLRAPGPRRGRLRSLELHGEVASLTTLVGEAPAVLEQVRQRIGPDATLDDPAVLMALPMHYQTGCRGACALAARCRRDAQACGDPAVLGDDAREALAPVGNVVHALALLRGQRAPRDAAEARLAQRLQRGFDVWRKAVNDVD